MPRVAAAPVAQLQRHYKRAVPRPLTPSQRSRLRRWLGRLPYYRHRLRFHTADRLPIHAASFLPHRRVVIDRGLLGAERDLPRILYHEVFHFVWARLGNPLRLSYEVLLRREWAARARGELGWPSEQRKLRLTGDVRRRTRPWRDYVCESFCDSAAWLCLPQRSRHPEWTLKPRFRERRRRWFLASDILPRLRF